MRARLFIAALLGAAVLSPTGATAGGPLAPCGSKDLLCGAITVPLDYSGAVPGQISLHVEEVPAAAPARGVVLLVAGGPGQASTKTFDLGASASFWRRLFPGYTLVAYDDRGSGQSGPLSCPNLLGRANLAAPAASVGLCGELLGATRPFYATRDHAEDIEAVRQGLGVDRLALWGASYGTKQVLGYAIAHPDRVERIVLDSVDRPEGPDPFATDTLRAIPLALGSICRGGVCRSTTTDPGGDLARLANRLAARPLDLFLGARIDGVAVLRLAVEADLSPGLAAELPGAVAAANAGRLDPLKRLFVLAGFGDAPGGTDFNPTLQAATVCDDGPFPWQADAAVSTRQQSIDEAIAALPPGSTGPFGSWATALGTVAECKEWPAPTGGRALPAGPLPDVPALVLAGDRDMRTPLEGAAQVAARFPQGHLVVAPGVGHGVTGSSTCVDLALRDWVNGATPPAACPRVAPAVAPLGPIPGSLAGLAPFAPVPGLAGRTLAAVAWTLQEACAASLLADGGQASFAGLEGGRLKTRGRLVFRLEGYSDVRGVSLSGAVLFVPGEGRRLSSLVGELRVAGRAAAPGHLSVSGSRLSGELGGRRVSVRLRS